MARVPTPDPHQDENLLDLVRGRAEQLGDRVFMTFVDGESMTFSQFAQRVAGVRSLLGDLDVGKGDRVALMMKNSLFYPVAWLGIVTRGAIAVPVNSRLGELDARYILDHGEATACITDEATSEVARTAGGETRAYFVARTGEAMEELAAVEVETSHELPPETPANIQYTSGTTGFPKGCVLTHRYWQRMGIAARHLMGIGKDDTMLTAQPHSYIDPQWNVMAALQAGAHLVLLDGFHPSSLMRSLAEHAVTFFYCLGVMPTLMLKQAPAAWDRSHKLERVYCSAIPPQLHRAIEQRWGVPWFETFGMTETGINTGVTPEDHDVAVATGCIGRAVEHCEVSVVDKEGREVDPGQVGEMRVRGLGLMDRYLKDPAATTAFFKEGWAHTGDLVERDENGLIYYRGRRKEMIRRGGENISPVEIEAQLSDHPDVLECAVAPVPDDDLGEEIKAYVIRVPEAMVGAEDLHAFLGSRLARFKLPRYYEFRATLPHTPSERVAKPLLEEGRSSFLEGTIDLRAGSSGT